MDWVFDFVRFVDSFGYCFDSRIEERKKKLSAMATVIGKIRERKGII